MHLLKDHFCNRFILKQQGQVVHIYTQLELNIFLNMHDMMHLDHYIKSKNHLDFYNNNIDQQQLSNSKVSQFSPVISLVTTINRKPTYVQFPITQDNCAES